MSAENQSGNIPWKWDSCKCRKMINRAVTGYKLQVRSYKSAQSRKTAGVARCRGAANFCRTGRTGRTPWTASSDSRARESDASVFPVVSPVYSQLINSDFDRKNILVIKHLITLKSIYHPYQVGKNGEKLRISRLKMVGDKGLEPLTFTV